MRQPTVPTNEASATRPTDSDERDAISIWRRRFGEHQVLIFVADVIFADKSLASLHIACMASYYLPVERKHATLDSKYRRRCGSHAWPLHIIWKNSPLTAVGLTLFHVGVGLHRNGRIDEGDIRHRAKFHL